MRAVAFHLSGGERAEQPRLRTIRHDDHVPLADDQPLAFEAALGRQIGGGGEQHGGIMEAVPPE